MDTNLLGLCIEMLTKIPNNFIKAEHKTKKVGRMKTSFFSGFFLQILTEEFLVNVLIVRNLMPKAYHIICICWRI